MRMINIGQGGFRSALSLALTLIFGVSVLISPVKAADIYDYDYLPYTREAASDADDIPWVEFNEPDNTKGFACQMLAQLAAEMLVDMFLVGSQQERVSDDCQPKTNNTANADYTDADIK